MSTLSGFTNLGTISLTEQPGIFKDITKLLQSGNPNINDIFSGLLGLFGLVLFAFLISQMVSFPKVYKNVHRFFFTTLSFTVGQNLVSVSSTQDPYQCFGRKFTSSLITLLTEEPYSLTLSLPSKSKYSFDGAIVESQLIGAYGYVTIDKSVEGSLTLTPYLVSTDGISVVSENVQMSLRISWSQNA